MKRVNYHLEESQIERLQRRSDATGVPVAYMIRLAVEQFLKTAEAEDRKPPKPKRKPAPIP